MIAPTEEFRRWLLLLHAMWDARKELFNRTLGIDRDELDWFECERFDRALDAERSRLRRHEAHLFRAALKGEADVIHCTPTERKAAVDLAVGILDGNLSTEAAFAELCSDAFPRHKRARRKRKR